MAGSASNESTTTMVRDPAIRPFEIDGLDIQFAHLRSPHDDALPLLMTHGWPGSIIEFPEGHRAASSSRLR
jgi:hypothetical protein